MWPLFTEEWGSWRSLDLNLSALPFTDPVTGLPIFHERHPSPLLLYGFSKEVVECPGYWPSKVRVCGFWFPPREWQFSCTGCAEICASVSSGSSNKQNKLCSIHLSLQLFIESPATELPIFIGLSSIGSMGFLRNPRAFLRVLGTALDISGGRFILFSAGYEPLEAAIDSYAKEASSCPEQTQRSNEGVSLFGGRLFCFSGSVPYNWLFPRCAAAIHHGGRLDVFHISFSTFRNCFLPPVVLSLSLSSHFVLVMLLTIVHLFLLLMHLLPFGSQYPQWIHGCCFTGWSSSGHMPIYAGSILLGGEDVLAWGCPRAIEKRALGARQRRGFLHQRSCKHAYEGPELFRVF